MMWFVDEWLIVMVKIKEKSMGIGEDLKPVMFQSSIQRYSLGWVVLEQTLN